MPNRDDAGSCSANTRKAKASANTPWPLKPACAPMQGSSGVTNSAVELWVSPRCCTILTMNAGQRERHPTQEHPYEGSSILRAQGYPEEMIHAILGHAHYCDVERVSPLDHALFACDELAGFLTACALIKPSKSIHEVETASVKRN